MLGVFLFCLGALCYALLGILSQLSKSPDGMETHLNSGFFMLLARLLRLFSSQRRDACRVHEALPQRFDND